MERGVGEDGVDGVRSIAGSGRTLRTRVWAAQAAVFLAGALGRQEEAIRSFEEAVRYSGGSPYAIGYLACAYAVAGRRVEAERQLAALHDRAQHGWVPALSVAIAHLGLGPVDRVFEWLERAYEERDLWLLWHTYDPIFQTIRSDPRMIDLLRRLGVPE